MIIRFDSKKSNHKDDTQQVNKTTKSPTPTPFKILNAIDTQAQTKRSKNGCLTCKVRKKKCDEIKPICSDCSRLGKECVYIDYQAMDPHTIKEIKARVEENEFHLKLRKRRRVAKDTSTSPMDFQSYKLLKSNMSDRSSAPNSPDISNLLNNDSEDSYADYAQIESANNILITSNIGQSTSLRDESDQLLKSSFIAEPHKDDDDTDDGEEKTSSRFEELQTTDSPKSLDEEHGSLVTPFYNEKNFKLIFENNKDSPKSPNTLSGFKEHLFLNENNDLTSFINFVNNPLSPKFTTNNNPQNLNVISPPPNLNGNLLSTLSPRGRYLYDYYVNVICNSVSVAPKLTKTIENCYLQVFVPLALQDEGVMYSILSWACFHIGQPEDIQEGLNYVMLALRHFHSQSCYDKDTVIRKISSLLILLAAEICRGDVKNWTKYLDWGSKLVNAVGGIESFRQTKQQFWLISNFAYHDVLASDKVEKGLYFSNNEYSDIFTNELSNGILNPLVGVAKEIFLRIGEISALAYETNTKLANLKNELNEQNISTSPVYEYNGEHKDGNTPINGHGSPDSDISNHAKINEILLSVKLEAMELDKRIEAVKPEPKELIDLSDQEFEWQITLFETFKLSAKLYLRQAILKCNPSSLESQIITNDLIKCLDIILGSPVEASLVFPVFMAAIHCINQFERDGMINRIDKFIQTYGTWSINRAKVVIEKIWQANPDGDKVVDWNKVLKDLGWNINFA